MGKSAIERMVLNTFALIMIVGCLWGMQYVWMIIQGVVALIGMAAPQ